jgi:hypothetical protein
MTRIRRLAFAQRVVIVIGLGLLLGVVGLYVVTDGFVASSGAWFAYAAGTDVYFSVRRASIMRTIVAPAALVIGWSVCSVWLLGAPPADE